MSLNFNDPLAHGAYLLWDGGVLKFDMVEEQSVRREGDIVEHPVETGANITDHYRVKLRSVKLTAFVSQEPIDPSLYPEAGGHMQTVQLVLPDYPAPSVAGVISSALQDPTAVIVKSLARKPPTRFNDWVLAYDNPVDTLAKVEATLDDLMANATLIDVVTKSVYYAQHLIEDIDVKRNFGTGTGATIEITLKQVIFVSTSTVAAPPTPKKPKDKPAVDKGKQNPTPAPLQSLAATLVDKGSGGSTPTFFTSGGPLNLPIGAL